MARLRINSGTNGGTRITSMDAGEVFEFTTSTKGNNGHCIRIKDSKKGKNRFVNLESGKVLTAGAGDYGFPVDASLEVAS
jgi:hypothetical protein